MYNIQYYKRLDYRIILEKDSFETETWFIAYCEELGKMACYGQGETAEKALKDFYKTKNDFIELLFKQGKKIPEPLPAFNYESCNGNISFRTTPQTHALLLKEAGLSGVSLNLFINNNLLIGLRASSLEHINKKLKTLEDKLDKHHRYAETKKISYEKSRGSIAITFDPFADATEYWVENVSNKSLDRQPV